MSTRKKNKKGEASKSLESLESPLDDRVLTENEAAHFMIQCELNELHHLRTEVVPQLMEKIEEFIQYARDMEQYVAQLEWELERLGGLDGEG